MKGDGILLGGMGLSIIVVPFAAMLWAGVPLNIPFLAPVAATASHLAQENLGVFFSREADEQVLSGSNKKKEISSPVNFREECKQTYYSPIKEFRILNRTTGKVEKVAIQDYVRGAIAAEMPATFHKEALKAQGVAALSYALHMALSQREHPDADLRGADFSADPENRQGYMTGEAIKIFYGDMGDYYWEKVASAAEEACGVVATYEGKPIAAAYHAISGGVTENAVNIWCQSMPYLVEADSSWDMLAQGYKKVITIGKEEMAEKLQEAGVELQGDFTTWIEIEERSPAGYVTRVRAGNQTFHGNELRNILGLRSACFYLSTQSHGFVFEVQGYGHGAGLSQNGADYLARQGKNFCQILHHYYSGIELEKIRF